MRTGAGGKDMQECWTEGCYARFFVFIRFHPRKKAWFGFQFLVTLKSTSGTHMNHSFSSPTWQNHDSIPPKLSPSPPSPSILSPKNTPHAPQYSPSVPPPHSPPA